MRGKHFVLRSEFEELDGLLAALALEDVEVFDHKLVLLGPSDPQATHLFVETPLRLPESCEGPDTAWIQQVEHLLVVDLQEAAEHAHVPGDFLFPQAVDLVKDLSDATLDDAFLDSGTLRYSLSAVCIDLAFVSFHGVGLARASLSIGKDGGVVAFDNLVDQVLDAKTFKDLVLVVIGVKNLVEGVDLLAAEPIGHSHGLGGAFVVILACNFNLLLSNLELRALVTCFDLVLQHGPHPHCHFDVGLCFPGGAPRRT